jgi:fibronectin-binding autotransporter adhesin
MAGVVSENQRNQRPLTPFRQAYPTSYRISGVEAKGKKVYHPRSLSNVRPATWQFLHTLHLSKLKTSPSLPCMKPNAFTRSFLLALGSLAAFSPASAADLTWDPLKTGTSDGAGAWLDANQWWNGTTSADWTSGDRAFFGNGGIGGAVTLDSPTTVGSLTFNAFTGTYTLGTAGQSITLDSGITMNSAAGNVTLISPITLGAAQSWRNNSSGLLTVSGAVTNAGHLLTIGGTGSMTASGIISGAGGLTKTGSGTLTLSGANDYTGATTVTGGTLTVSGSLGSSSNLTMGGSTFNYSNTGAGQTLSGLTISSGSATVNNTASGRTLALGAITRAEGEYGQANFATLTGTITTTTANVNGIIAPWVTTGTGTSLRYAIGSADGTTATNITALTGTAAGTNLANVTNAAGNFEYSAAVTTSANYTANTLRFSGTTNSVTTLGATNTLTLNGFMNSGGGTGTLTISGGPGTGGIIIGSNNELVIAANNRGTTISAVIADGGSAGRLVYSGGGTLTLSGANTFTGGLVINSGNITLGTGGVDSLGAANSSVTLNRTTTISVASATTFAKSFLLNNGANLSLSSSANGITITGAVTGTGGVFATAANNALNQRVTTLASTGNTFSGSLNATRVFSDIVINSLFDGPGAGNINYGETGTATTGRVAWGANAVSALVLNNRRLVISGTTQTAWISNNNGTIANTVTVNTDLVNNATNATLTLGGANIGSNTIAGTISDGSGIVSVAKEEGGTWALSGNNSYTGGTTISAGILRINNASAIGTGRLTINGGTIDNTSGSAITLSNNNLQTWGGNFAFTGTNDLNLGTGEVTINAARTVTTTAGTLTVGGNISGAFAFTKDGAGTLVLGGASTYSGVTTVQRGNLVAAANAPSGSAGAFGNATTEIALGVAGNNNAAGILIDGAHTVGRSIRNATSDATDAGTRILTLGGNSAHNSEFSGNIFLGTSAQTSKGIQLTAAAGGQVTFSGVIQNPSGQAGGEITSAAALDAVTKVGAGTVILSNTNTYTGRTVVNEGTLIATQAGALSGYNSSGKVIFNGGTVGVQVGDTGWSTAQVDTMLTNATKTSGALGIDTTNGSLTQWTDFTTENLGELGLNKLGAGTLTLTGNNTYTGATSVSAGTLLVNGALGDSAVTVASGAVVGGSGMLGGTLAFEAGSRLALAGATLGLSSTDILTVAAGKTITLNNFTFENLTGWDWANAEEGTYTLIHGGGTVLFEGSTATAANPYYFGDGKMGYFQKGSLQAVIIVIPEPRAAFLGGLGLLVLLRRRR